MTQRPKNLIWKTIGYFWSQVWQDALMTKNHKEANMRTLITSLAASFFLLVITASNVAAHCEIPCGIYDDELRANLISD